MPLDVCILQILHGREEFRPVPELARMIAAPIMDELTGRMGLIAQYEWPPRPGQAANPIVTVQLAPSANVKGIEDVRVIACQVEVGDFVVCGDLEVRGVITRSIGWCTYPDLTNRIKAYRVRFDAPLSSRAHGSPVRLKSGHLIGMLVATQNEDDGGCRALVYPA